MAGIDPFASITVATLDLLTRDGDLFLTLGTNLFRGLAVILVAWFGIRAALTSAEGGPPLPLASFASLLLTIAFGFTMMTYYRAPIPGLGISFTQLLTDQPIFLARQLEVTQVQRLSDRLNELYLSMEQPLLFNVPALVGYFLMRTAIDFNANSAVGLDGALERLRHQMFGAWILGVAAAGLLTFATFSLFEARYRRL